MIYSSTINTAAHPLTKNLLSHYDENYYNNIHFVVIEYA